MKNITPLHRLLLFTFFLNLSPTLQAHSEHKHDHPSNDKPAAQFTSLREAWTSIQSSMEIIESALNTKELSPIHDAEEKITSALSFMKIQSPMVTGDKSKRLDSAIKQTIQIAQNLHHASDSNDTSKAIAEFKKLQSALKLVAVQYPKDTLTSP